MCLGAQLLVLLFLTLICRMFLIAKIAVMVKDILAAWLKWSALLLMCEMKMLNE